MKQTIKIMSYEMNIEFNNKLKIFESELERINNKIESELEKLKIEKINNFRTMNLNSSELLR